VTFNTQTSTKVT